MARFFVVSFVLLQFVFIAFAMVPHVNAQEEELLPVITVINPIRGKELGHEKDDLLASLQAHWEVTQDVGVNAAWLWQYTALEDDSLVNFAKESMQHQEYGLLLEIDRNSAQKAGVQYRGQGPSYFSDGLFLVSYDKEERKKLIDASFAKFKEKFGYYPKTVGAWWIGADSLTYMQKKYGIVAAMKAADQFDLDMYSLWGSPWSIPYVASVRNELIPAGSEDDSSHVVILQWAARDPTEGYADATYSVQDYYLPGYTFPYVYEYLFPLFLQQPLDNITIGIENGGTITSFENGYKLYIEKAKELEGKGKVDILLVQDYAKKFLAQKKTFANSDVRYYLTKAYSSEDQSFWYNSTHFRAGIMKNGDNVYLVDLRDYSGNVEEEFAFLPNSQGKLRASTPAIIDSMKLPSQKLLIAKSKGKMEIREKDGVVTLFVGDKTLATFTRSSLEIVADKGGVKTFVFDGKQHDGGIVIHALLPYFPLNKSTLLVVCGVFFAIALVLVLVSILLYKKTRSRKVLYASFAGIPLILILFGGVVYLSRTTYVITPFEMKALDVIKEKKKDVLFIEEYDYGIRPIYKAVKPLLYVNYRIGGLLTGTDWQIVARAENNVTKLSGHDDKLVVVPRYLGADFSEDEAKLNGMKKIFDNGQIAIFEKL